MVNFHTITFSFSLTESSFPFPPLPPPKQRLAIKNNVLATCTCGWVLFCKEVTELIHPHNLGELQPGKSPHGNRIEFIWWKWVKDCCTKELLLENIFNGHDTNGKEKSWASDSRFVPSGIVGFLQWLRSSFVTLSDAVTRESSRTISGE